MDQTIQPHEACHSPRLDAPSQQTPMKNEASADLHCELCVVHRVERIAGAGKLTWELVEESTKHKLFHETCPRCDDPKSSSSVRLCLRCRHLRIQHLLICRPDNDYGFYRSMDKYEALRVRMEPFGEQSDRCDLCQCLHRALYDQPHVSQLNKGFVLSIRQRGQLLAEVYNVSFAYFYAERPDEERRKVREHIDWEWTRKWLETPRKAHASDQEFQLHLQEFRDILVIDTSQERVVELPDGAEYTALSYVWGANSEGQLRTLLSNLDTLRQPGALKNANLPRTVSDAMAACAKLGCRYIWVDRLCFVQDKPPDQMAEQLKHMATIYHQATLTIVAGAGDSASHGLPGVSYARDAKQQTLSFDEQFVLVAEIPNLKNCLGKSTWETRGWTYQEYAASLRLLIFTDYGLHLKVEGDFAIESEGPTNTNDYGGETQGLEIISTYTDRTLSFPADILRGVTGILHAVYGDRTHYGMPLDDFDRALGWTFKEPDHKPRASTGADTFPTWSWTSSGGPVLFRLTYGSVCSLAYWARALECGTAKSLSFQWSAIGQSSDHGDGPDSSSIGKHTYLSAALAWSHGCIDSDVPKDLVVDCATPDYEQRLSKRWQYRSLHYWKDAFQNYEERLVFDSANVTLPSAASQIIAYTSKASFTLDWSAHGGTTSEDVEDDSNSDSEDDEEDNNAILIRNQSHQVVGTIELDEYSIQKLKHSDRTAVEFIAISTGDHSSRIERHLSNHFNHLTTSALYGCPCAFSKPDDQEPNHIPECPKHADFPTHASFQPDPAVHTIYSSFDGEIEERRAHYHHLAQLSYFDINGALLHEWNQIPELNVMLVVPSPGGKVYQRLGIGQIYLKRWAEALPKFEYVVLE